MMKAGTIIPQSLRAETELYSRGWEIIKNAGGDAVDRDIRRAHWNFFFLAASTHATALGYLRNPKAGRVVSMLSPEAVGAWFSGLRLSIEARSTVENIRTSGPFRLVGGGRANVAGRYPSRKMGVTIQFESHRVELAFLRELEHDPWASGEAVDNH